MLGKINLVEYEKCYPKRLKNYFKRNINYLPQTYDEIIPNMERAVVGNIPPEIIKLFDTDKEAKIKAFQKMLAYMAIYVRSTYKQMKGKQMKAFAPIYSLENIKEYEKSITTIINKKLQDIIGADYNAELKFANNGGFAELFRLSIKDKDGNKIMHDKAFKVFYNIIEPFTEHKSHHNNFAEANFWTYISHNAGHKLDNTQFTRHYISDMESGYYLTEFIDEDIHKTTSYLNLQLFGIKFTDLGNNTPILGKMYDGGGYNKTADFIDDKVVLRYYKKIVNRNTHDEREQVLKNLEKIVENKKIPHRSKIIKAIDIYKKSQKQTVVTKPKKPSIIDRFVNFLLKPQNKIINYLNSKSM